jgi:hypothetical protein
MTADAKAANASELSPLIGRETEREHLREAMARAAAGTGQAVLVTGQPGVGKSALLAAARADASAVGFLVLSGRGHRAERGLGYGPVIEAFGWDLGRLGVRRVSALVHGLAGWTGWATRRLNDFAWSMRWPDCVSGWRRARRCC